jgi:hypothetical protein
LAGNAGFVISIPLANRLLFRPGLGAMVSPANDALPQRFAGNGRWHGQIGRRNRQAAALNTGGCRRDIGIG